MRDILHCDMNNFFASVECKLHPELKGYPVAVCGSVEERHGIVLAKNELAKACGVKTAETIASAKSKCRGLITVPPHFEEYLKYSRLARSIYERYTDLVEPFGMDECWLDISGTRRLFGAPEKVADEIRCTVKEELGLTISVGVSFNKVFAKLGSDMKKPDAVTVIPKESFREKIWGLPLSDMIGAGRATTAKLANYGIYTLGELAACDSKWIQKILGKNGYLLWRYANGNDDSQVQRTDFSMPAKSVGHGVTTTSDICRNETAKAILLELSQDIGRRLASQEKFACKVSVTARMSDLTHISWQTDLPTATRSPMIIADTAYRLFSGSYEWTRPVRALTVTAFALVDNGFSCQTDLFNDTHTLDKMEKADDCIMQIRRRFGDSMIKNALLLSPVPIPETKSVVSLPGGIPR